MQQFRQQYEIEDSSLEVKNEIMRYVSFWPYLIILLTIFVSSVFLYLRYTDFNFKTTTVIEILDESQNREMALPTELTVFNRSMINLENEINRLTSYALNSSVVKDIKANILYYEVGRIKKTQTTSESWFNDYKLDFIINTDLIEENLVFKIYSSENKLEINTYDSNENFIKTNKFNSLTTLNEKHNLPFNLTIDSDDYLDLERELRLVPVKSQTNKFRSSLKVMALGQDSDQLSLTLTHENPSIAQMYLNALTSNFDNDGIFDRKLEYNRTIEFVNIREKILKQDLNLIEAKKQSYKQDNNLTDIKLDANNNIDLKYTYNSEIFQLESQRQIAEYLNDLIDETEYGYLPINIGLENFDLNNMINQYNSVVSDRLRYLNESGSNNFLVKSLEPQLENLIQNISTSLANFSGSIDLKLKNLKLKELQFDVEYNKVPENEKTLRSIERELSIKEALYLLLLQKREEASINLAVVKPTIKVIDYAITNYSTKSPNSRLIYFAAIGAAIVIYILFLWLWFFLDNKVHSKEQLEKLINPEIPIIGEIPFINDFDASQKDFMNRSVISESIRMLISNLRFTTFKDMKSEKGHTIIFTSSIKGEGKTLASVSTAMSLANDMSKDKKVVLIGTDLRNPQVHKNFGVEKTQIGLSDLIYKNDYKNFKNYISRFDNLDVLFSGSIPPNPTAMLSSKTFENLIAILKDDYDYIIIDSAPCLLVSDTLQFINFADSIVYLFRSNFTDSKITNYINEIFTEKQIKNLNIVMNAVGNSSAYGYKYGYQYGYKYGYKYSYNYGYGYGYSADK